MNKIIIMLVVIIAAISCKNTTPSETATEADNTTTSIGLTTETPKAATNRASFPSLSFKLDGILVEGTVPGVMALYVPAKKEATIRATTPKGVFSIIMDKVEGTGTYTIKGTSTNAAGILGSSKMYEVKKSGTLFTVTIDAIDEITAINTSDAKAIHGTFQGKFMDDDGNTITITEGKYHTQ